MDKTKDYSSDFFSKRISGACRFDIDEISDRGNPLPHMLPPAEYFSDCVSKLGLSSSDHIIVYTVPGCFSASRVWWTFKAFQHHKVSVLDGGLAAWERAGGETSSGPEDSVVATQSRGTFTATLDPRLVATWEEVLGIVNSGSAQILDARPLARFRAEVPEPRPGLPGGHIPGSLSLPLTAFVKDGDPTTFRSPAEIQQAFEEAGVILEAGGRVVTSCGSGVTASVLTMALCMLGRDVASIPVYDGSWTEWGGRPDLPNAKNMTDENST